MFGQLLVLSEKNNFDLQKIMPYQLAPIPWCLATGDGLPAKTDKAKMLHTLETDQAAIVNPGNDKISA